MAIVEAEESRIASESEWGLVCCRGEPVVAKRGPGRPRKNPLPSTPSKGKLGKLKVKAGAMKVRAVQPVSSPPPLPPFIHLICLVHLSPSPTPFTHPFTHPLHPPPSPNPSPNLFIHLLCSCLVSPLPHSSLPPVLAPLLDPCSISCCLACVMILLLSLASEGAATCTQRVETVWSCCGNMLWRQV